MCAVTKTGSYWGISQSASLALGIRFRRVSVRALFLFTFYLLVYLFVFPVDPSIPVVFVVSLRQIQGLGTTDSGSPVTDSGYG